MRFWTLTALVLAALLSTVERADAKDPAPLKILFLGDRGHHRPADRAAQLIPVMKIRGIDITYTERLDDLNLDTLIQYDGLIIFANWGSYTDAHEKALLDYVASGKGFIPLHCASYCFIKSQKYIDLVGAQFQRHGFERFETHIVDDDHPITKNAWEFFTFDETYVHTKHNEKDRRVLQIRKEKGKDEPWTWIRKHGKGRVFYTAYGHDHRTWGHPGFHSLVERGIRWACGDDSVIDNNPLAHMPKAEDFEYTEAKLPNYLPGRRWGTQGDPISVMQKPISPKESMKHMVVPDGLEVQLFVAEPEIRKPLCMTWDERGRLWIAETFDYPNEIQPEDKGRDSIKICEDTDGDGRADKFTIFADKLSIPTSLCHANGGLLVHQAPLTLFLKDTDGDDIADVREVLFSGWSTGDTHAGPSNMHYGFDNQIYGMVGYSGFRGKIGDEDHSFRTGFYRFRADGSKAEFLRNTNNNSWGVGFSEEGVLFGSTANGNPSVYMPIPNRYYEAVRGWSSRRLENTAIGAKFYPITEKVRQVDHHGNFTAAAGHALYTARAYPKHYWNQTAFVTGPPGHLCATFLIEKKGADFVSRNSWNLFASGDEWTAPIMAEVGPDGSVWMIDWYNYIVQHNPTPRGFRNGKGNAYVTDLRDKTHGRIYRIVPKGTKGYRSIDLSKATGAELVAQLKNDNLFWRRTAQRLLVTRGKKDVRDDLVALARGKSIDAIGNAPGVIHALWTLHGLGLLSGDDAEAVSVAHANLRHASAGARKAALDASPRNAAFIEALVAAGSLTDDDGQVRLSGFLALAESPASARAASAIINALGNDANLNDRWIPDAATSAAARHDTHFLTLVAADTPKTIGSDSVKQLISRVAEHHARGKPTGSGVILASLASASREVADLIITGFEKGWPSDHALAGGEKVSGALVQVLERLSPQHKGKLVSLANRWKVQGLEKFSQEIADGFLEVATDTKRSDKDRAEAARELVAFLSNDEEVLGELIGLIGPSASFELSKGLFDAVSQSASKKLGDVIVEALGGMTPSVKREAQLVLLKQSDWTRSLVEGALEGDVDITLLTLDQKQQLTRHGDKKVAADARKLLAAAGALPNPDRQKVIDELLPLLEKRPGDAKAGFVHFEKACAKCHTHSGKGTKIGPDLTGMAAHPKEELLQHIIDPSRSVEGNYRLYTVITNTGRTLNGMLASETKTSIEIFDAEGKKTVLLREDVARIDGSRMSLMPDGFEKQLGNDGIGDLLAFLTKRGKYLPLPLEKAATIVTTKGMFFNESSRHERMVFRDWTPKTFEGVPFHLVDPQVDKVPNAIMLRSTNGAISSKMPTKAKIPCNSSARAIHMLSGVSGWGATSDRPGSVSLIVRLHYGDGKQEDHELRNGVHFSDYIRRIDVPGSKFAFNLRGKQLRYLVIHPKRDATIREIEFLKGRDNTAPIIMSVTAESAGE